MKFKEWYQESLNMYGKPQLLRASLVSPLVAMFPLIILSASIIVGELFDIPWLASNDDTPVRAAGMMLLLVFPFFYIPLTLSMLFVGVILQYFSILSRKSISVVCVITSIFFGFRAAWLSEFGVDDKIFSFCFSFSFSLISLFLGSMCWIKIAQRKKC